MLTIRPFQDDDFDLLLDLANQAVPFAPHENETWLSFRLAFDETRALRRHFIAEQADEPVGYGCLEQQSEDPTTLRIFIVGSPELVHGEVGDALYDKLLHDAEALGEQQLWCRELLADRPICRFFEKKGFKETQRFQLPGSPAAWAVVMEKGIA